LREVASHVRSPLFLATSRPRRARRCSKPTATPSATATGCGCTTAWCETSTS
jgi:hypothetical protein